jgi:hypothetical protein
MEFHAAKTVSDYHTYALSFVVQDIPGDSAVRTLPDDSGYSCAISIKGMQGINISYFWATGG